MIYNFNGVFHQAKMFAAANMIKRCTSSEKSTLPENLRKAYKLYQMDNGVPVHLKAGLRDVLLYRGTAIGVVIGYAYSVYCIIAMAFPSRKK